MKQASSLVRKTGRPLSFDRADVLQKAMLTFWRSGYETTSINQLTAAMGLTAPSLYGAFGDKRQLFLEAVRLYAGSPADLNEKLARAPTARDAVHRLLTASAAAFTGDITPRGCLLASATASGTEDAAEVRAAVAAIRRDIETCIRQRIERDVALRVLPDATDCASLAALAIAIIQGMSTLARDGSGREKLLDLADLAMLAWAPKAGGLPCCTSDAPDSLACEVDDLSGAA